MKKIIPILISVFLITVNVLCANASENILRGVDVVKADNSYKIELSSNEPAQMTRTVLSANRIILNLKNISLSSNVSTKFDGNSVIDNVIVEQSAKDNVNIFVQGENIAYSNVEFKEPAAFETVQDSVQSSFSSLFSILSGASVGDRKVQFGIIFLFIAIVIGEIKFIVSKYTELKEEKIKMLNDIELTSDFKDYLPGYTKTGLNKPYTTPVYSVPAGRGNSTNPIVNTKIARPNILVNLKTPETVTLNSLLYNKNREEKIIDRIVNNVHVFGSLSNITKESSGYNANTISNPIEKISSNIKHLENMTQKYRDSANSQKVSYKRLNRIS